MRRIVTILAIGLFSATAFAATRDGAPRDWVRRAPLTAAAFDNAVVQANLTDATGNRPIVLLETNYYTFNPGDPLQLRVTVDPNGFGAPATMYLYWENRTTASAVTTTWPARNWPPESSRISSAPRRRRFRSSFRS